MTIPAGTFPARTRLRLATQNRIDRTANWLIGHGRIRAAELLWRTFRML